MVKLHVRMQKINGPMQREKERYRLLNSDEKAFYEELPDTFTHQASLKVAKSSDHVDTPRELQLMLSLFEELGLIRAYPWPRGTYEKTRRS